MIGKVLDYLCAGAADEAIVDEEEYCNPLEDDNTHWSSSEQVSPYLRMASFSSVFQTSSPIIRNSK